MDLSGTRSCRVPESCPWAKLRNTNFKKIVSLNFWTRLRDTTRFFVSLIVSLSCPLIVSLRDTNRVQIFGPILDHLGTRHDLLRDTIVSCPWIVSMNFLAQLWQLRDTIQGHESCRVPESCPWIVSLNFLARLCWPRDTFRDTIQGHDTIPGTRHDSCPWKSLKFRTRFVSLRDTIKGHDRDTIRDTIVSLSRVPESCPWTYRQGRT